MLKRHALVAAITTSLFASFVPMQPASAGITLTPEQEQQIDALFARFDTPTSPGCSLGIMSDGRMLYARGYGMANIDAGIANDSSKLFDIASDSKQFTAGAIVRLAQQGKLKLSDDVRKYIPELPNYGRVITINHLLWHTGGLRDYGFLLGMTGYELSDTVTEARVLELIFEQRKPDFAAGTRHEYSNTGYVLLGLIVKRVSGTSLNAYTRQRLFAPLGMSQSVWRDKHDKAIPNRALGYDNPDDPDQFEVTLSNWETVGDGGLHTSIEEIQKWDENFYTGQVGGPDFISEMYRTGTLSDGTPLHYARGLTIHTYRGLKRITHGGDWIGYTSMTQRFPDQHTSVMLMCNRQGSDQYTLTDEIDDVILADHFTEPKPTDPEPAPSLPLSRFVGHYFSASAQAVIRTYIDQDSNELMLLPYGDGAAEPLTSIGPTTFLIGGSPDTRVNFTVQGSNPASKVTVNFNTLDLDARPIQSSRFTPVTATNLSQYTGTFNAPEFDGLQWTLVVNNGQLKLRSGGDVDPEMAGPLKPANAADTFVGNAGYLRFTRNAMGRIDGFYLSLPNSTDYRFNKQ